MRLNLGCGREVADGWVNVDVDQYDTWPPMPDEIQLSPHARFEALPGVYLLERYDRPVLPFHDSVFDGAVAHHVLQMIAWPELVPWLTEVRRVLKPGAVLRVTVPDLIAAVGAWECHLDNWFPVDGETGDEKLCVYLSQNGATRSVFTQDALALLFGRAGFVPCQSDPWLAELDSRLHESILLEGMRP